MKYEIVDSPKPATSAALEKLINKAAALKPDSRLVSVLFDTDDKDRERVLLVFEEPA
jgi:hypothetical protein